MTKISEGVGPWALLRSILRGPSRRPRNPLVPGRRFCQRARLRANRVGAVTSVPSNFRGEGAKAASGKQKPGTSATHARAGTAAGRGHQRSSGAGRGDWRTDDYYPLNKRGAGPTLEASTRHVAPENACQREPNRHPHPRLRPWLRPRPRAHSNPLNSGWRAENVVLVPNRA